MIATAAAAIAAAVLFVIAVIAAGLLYAVKLIEQAGGLEGAANIVTEQLADSLTESGFDRPTLDPSDPLLKSRVIVITEAINERSAQRTVRELLYLDALDPSGRIQLFISSPGGWLDSAFAIVDVIEAITAPVDVIALGGCHSACTVVLASGTGLRSATRNAMISVHANLEPGDDPDSYERISRERFERHFREHAKLPETWFPLTGDRELYLTPERAIEHGLIDSIRQPHATPPAAQQGAAAGDG